METWTQFKKTKPQKDDFSIFLWLVKISEIANIPFFRKQELLCIGLSLPKTPHVEAPHTVYTIVLIIVCLDFLNFIEWIFIVKQYCYRLTIEKARK